MLPSLLLISGLAAPALAASVDNLEVGGPWGTPTAIDATAPWWNPAGLAVGEGVRLQLEIAPTGGYLEIDRDDPYNGGVDRFSLFAPVPYLGVGAGVGDRFALGAALAAPFGKGGSSEMTDGPGRYHMREGRVQALAGLFSAAVRPAEIVSVGGTFAMVYSQWGARADNSILVDLNAEIEELGQETSYDDSMIEDPDYGATLDFGTLTGLALTGGGGVMITPSDDLRIGVNYMHSIDATHTGQVAMDFGCPPQDDTLGRFGAEARGLCDADMTADAVVAYTLPARLNAGVMFRPTPPLRLELMGGYVFWSQLERFYITISNVEDYSDVPEDTADLINREQTWARDNRNTFWGAIDGKYDVSERLLLGGRALLDRSAVPDATLGPNNYDTNVLIVTGLGAWRFNDTITLGLSLSQHIQATRVNEDSAFIITLDESAQAEGAYTYTQMNGTYSGSTTRGGIALRVQL